MRQLADALGLARFAVLGHSGGGPHALACGVRLADRISALGVACGFAPTDRPGGTEGMQTNMARVVGPLRWFPWLAKPMLSSLPAAYRRDPRVAWEAQFGQGLPASDRAAFERPEVRENILAAAVEALRNGSSGIADELPLFLGRPWGFSPADVSVPTWFWYGQADTVAPIPMGRYLQAMPDARLEYPDDGHMVYITQWRHAGRADQLERTQVIADLCFVAVSVLSPYADVWRASAGRASARATSNCTAASWP